MPPLLYSAIVQATTDHTWALFHISAYYLIAFVILIFVNFDRGHRMAMATVGKTSSGNRCVAISPAPSGGFSSDVTSPKGNDTSEVAASKGNEGRQDET